MGWRAAGERHFPRGPEYPSYRQIDYWCRSGAIPNKESRGSGTGRERLWSDEECSKLRYLKLLCDAAVELGFGGLGRELVARTWAALDDHTLHTFNVGPIYVVIPAREEPPCTS